MTCLFAVVDHCWTVPYSTAGCRCALEYFLTYPLTSCLQDPEGKPKKANIRDNWDGTYTVSYVPDTAGRYTITIKYGGDEIPYSPYRIHAAPSGDASKCLVTGQTPPNTHPAGQLYRLKLKLCCFCPTVSIGGHGLGELSKTYFIKSYYLILIIIIILFFSPFVFIIFLLFCQFCINICIFFVLLLILFYVLNSIYF